MNKINRKLEYALIALKHMSQKIPGELTSAKEVSDSFHTPFDATARVMQQMAQQKGGLLRSEHGATGGYQITRDLAKVSIHDLLEVIEGPTALVKCLHKPHSKEISCDLQETCNIVSPLTQLNHRLMEFYKSVSLKELLIEKASPLNPTKKHTEAELHG
jgi:Rrf2 family protein